MDDVCFDSNVVKCLNEEVNSVRPFIQSIEMSKNENDEDHVVPRRSIFQIVIHRSKPFFPNQNSFYPVCKQIYLF